MRAGLVRALRCCGAALCVCWQPWRSASMLLAVAGSAAVAQQGSPPPAAAPEITPGAADREARHRLPRRAEGSRRDHRQARGGRRHDRRQAAEGARRHRPKHGFKDFADFEEIRANIMMVLAGIDPDNGEYSDPIELIKKDIEAIKADKALTDGRSQGAARGDERRAEGDAAAEVQGEHRRRQEVRQADRRGLEVGPVADAGRGRAAGRSTRSTASRRRRSPASPRSFSTGPHARNGLSLAMLEALHGGVRASSAARDDVKAIVLSAQRPGVLGRPRPQGDHRPSRRSRRRAAASSSARWQPARAMMQSIIACPKPVIAAVKAPRRRPAASSSRPAISRSPPTTRDSARRASISACSARRRWSR